MILRCTNKLLAVLGAGRAAGPGPAPDAEDWYANLLWFDRRKCLLLTHAATLFSIFEADLRAVELRATHRLVTELVERELRREGLPPATLGNLRAQQLILAKTADRSVRGCMNDMAFHCEVAISDAGGLAHFDLGELNARVGDAYPGVLRTHDLACDILGGLECAGRRSGSLLFAGSGSAR